MEESNSKMKNLLKNKTILKAINTMTKETMNRISKTIMMETMIIMEISTIITETTTITMRIMKMMTMISQNMLMNKTKDSMKL